MGSASPTRSASGPTIARHITASGKPHRNAAKKSGSGVSGSNVPVDAGRMPIALITREMTSMPMRSGRTLTSASRINPFATPCITKDMSDVSVAAAG